MPSDVVRSLLRRMGPKPSMAVAVTVKRPPATAGEPPLADEKLPPSPQGDEKQNAQERAGYVTHPGGPTCGNCEYADHEKAQCKQFKFAIDLENGCCDAWEAATETPVEPAGGEEPEPAREQSATTSSKPGKRRPRKPAAAAGDQL